MSVPETSLTLLLRDESATAALAAALAPRVGPGVRLYLSGELGSGKTAFTRALLRALGHAGRVRSPSFTLAEPYHLSSFALYHFDFYRFSDSNEWREAGFEEWLGDDTAAVVEWPEMAAGSLPAADLRLALAATDDPQQRQVRLDAGTERGQSWLNALAGRVTRGELDGICCSAPSAPRC